MNPTNVNKIILFWNFVAKTGNIVLCNDITIQKHFSIDAIFWHEVGHMIDEKELYSRMDIKEADPQHEKHRKEVIEQYFEYEIALMQNFKEQGKSLNDYIDHVKTTLWYIKDQRAQQIKKELGM